MKAVAKVAIAIHAGNTQNQYSVNPVVIAMLDDWKSYNILPHEGSSGSPRPSQLSEASVIIAPGTEVASVI